MKTFKYHYLEEAYTIFPKNEKEIEALGFPEDNTKEIITLFNYLKVKNKTPINIDPKKKSNVNVTRELQGVEEIAAIKIAAGLNKIKIKYGNGSSGNRGANNRGNAFEGIYATALNNWWEGNPIKDANVLDSINHLESTYNLSSSKLFKIDVVGEENTRRPLKFKGKSITLTNTKGSGFDIGSSVTDVTVTTDKGPLYLSLKLGGTTTFFNVGVKKILTKDEIEKSNITNKNGKALLNLFGIDEDVFCDVFNGKLKKGFSKSANYDKANLAKLLYSGIGYGYHVIHKMGKSIISKKMDKAAMKSAATIMGTPTIYYGGKTGKGKRIDVEFESKEYIFKINIRDTQGKDGYPSRMMCDFKHK